MTDQLYEHLSKETFLRINQIDKVDEFDLTKIEKGIISIHANWSGQSIMHGKSILNLIDKSESKDFEINIIDLETITPEKQISLIGTVSQGYFESVWVENGKIEFNYRDNNRATELNKFKEYLSKKINKSR